MTTNEATSTEDIENKSAAPAEGQKLAGCYLLKARVGAAGVGELWHANDDVLGRDISLQFVPDEIREDEKALVDVRQEIKRIRQLIHPNILRVYDFIEESDWAAVSMDDFEGESLASLISKRSSRVFSVPEIQPWVFQLCQTLEDAHKIGLFHRDISPANIYFRPDGRLFLAGFGFSRCVSDAVRRLGKNQNPVSANLSPQLLDGRPAARTDDIYACGALLFELLTGQAPFSGPEIEEAIRHSAPKAVGEVRPKDLEPVPNTWEKAIAACLSKNPVERPSGAGKLAERLKAAPVSESSVLEMLMAAPVEVKEAVVENKQTVVENQEAVVENGEAKKSAEPDPRPEASLKTPLDALVDAPVDAPVEAPARAPVSLPPSSFPPGRRNIASSADHLAPFTPPAPKSLPEKGLPEKGLPEKGALLESNISPKTPGTPGTMRPRTIKADTYSNFYGNRSRFPVMPVAVAAAVLLILGAIAYLFHGSHTGNPSGNASAPASSSTGTAASGETPGNNPSADGGKSATTNGSAVESPDAGGGKVNPQGQGTNAQIAATLPASASPAEIALAQKKADLDRVKQTAEAAGNSVGELTKQQQIAETDAAQAQKALDEKARSSIPVKKAADELLAKKKKLEDDQKTAEAAAEQAKQMADEKQRFADSAKQAVDDLVTKNQDKLAAADATDAQLAEMKKTLEDKQQAVTAAAKMRADADAERVKQADAVKASEQEVAAAAAALAQSQKAKDVKKEAILRLEKDAQQLKDRIKQLEDERKNIENGATVPDAGASLQPPPSAPPPSSSRNIATPNPSRSSSASPAPQLGKSLDLALPANLAPLPANSSPDLTMLVKPEGPKVTLLPGPGASETPGAVTPAATSGVNSLGQRFVPVGDVDFCIWQTRVKDFEVFARAVGLKSVGWRSPGFKQAPDHPVVNVTWLEAIAFCKWLTDKEHKEGSLPANQYYRLPTDLEWSKAVGLPEEPEKTPAERDMVITDVYPWGKDWPPPPGAGNYTGEETGSDVAIKGYNDGFAWTSPVGSFKPNKYGIYDMGGNVWQWCMDTWNDKSTGKVLRGASWYNGALKLSLLSSCRVHAAPDSSTDNYGFRIIKVTEESRASKK